MYHHMNKIFSSCTTSGTSNEMHLGRRIRKDKSCTIDKSGSCFFFRHYIFNSINIFNRDIELSQTSMEIRHFCRQINFQLVLASNNPKNPSLKDVRFSKFCFGLSKVRLQVTVCMSLYLLLYKISVICIRTQQKTPLVLLSVLDKRAYTRYYKELIITALH